MVHSVIFVQLLPFFLSSLACFFANVCKALSFLALPLSFTFRRLLAFPFHLCSFIAQQKVRCSSKTSHCKKRLTFYAVSVIVALLCFCPMILRTQTLRRNERLHVPGQDPLTEVSFSFLPASGETDPPGRRRTAFCSRKCHGCSSVPRPSRRLPARKP